MSSAPIAASVRRVMNLTQHEMRVLAVLDESTSQADGAASGHSLREQLLGLGLSKQEAVLAMGSLVDRGLLERVKVIDAEGCFYTGYRRAAPNG